MSRRWWILGGALVALAALGVGLGLAFSGGSGNGPPTATAAQNGLSWEQLYAKARVGQKEAAVLALWPKIPYQHYHDNLQEDCYEWQGDNLYDLCFKNGVLRLKTTF